MSGCPESKICLFYGFRIVPRCRPGRNVEGAARLSLDSHCKYLSIPTKPESIKTGGSASKKGGRGRRGGKAVIGLTVDTYPFLPQSIKLTLNTYPILPESIKSGGSAGERSGRQQARRMGKQKAREGWEGCRGCRWTRVKYLSTPTGIH